MATVWSKFTCMGHAAQSKSQAQKKKVRAFIIQLVCILVRLLDLRSFRRLGPLLNLQLCSKIMPITKSLRISEDRLVVCSYVAKSSTFVKDLLCWPDWCYQTPIKGELHLHFQGIQYSSLFICFLQVIWLSLEFTYWLRHQSSHRRNTTGRSYLIFSFLQLSQFIHQIHLQHIDE